MRDTIYSRFHRWVAMRPDSPAIVEDGRAVSYRQLDNIVDNILTKIDGRQALAAGLIDSEGRKEVCIGIVMSHGIEMIAAMLAVLKSGAAYVPAEPSLPQERIDYMMNSAGVGLIITDDFCKDLSKEKPTTKTLDDRSVPDGAAYVLYTSGTTGRPKGVIVENHSVVNYVEAFEHEFHVIPGDVMLQFSVCSFDILVEEVYTTLLNGATLAIPSRKVSAGSLADLMEFCERHNVTIISGFPYLLADMNRRHCFPSKLRLLISGGDVLRASYNSWLKNHSFMIYNTYGPSETTVCATYYRVDGADALDDGTYPVGKPVKGVEVQILDDSLREVHEGDVGEICIFGEGVSRGYLGNAPEQANFVKIPDGRRMYRSGDLGYYLPNGNIAFLHRKDRQVMILGKRVEPEEVENVLNESPCVERGVVRAFIDSQGLAYLTAYFIPSHKNCDISRIKDFLRSRLSDFMVPEFFVKMEEIPLTKRGKINDRALPVVMKEGVPR